MPCLAEAMLAGPTRLTGRLLQRGEATMTEPLAGEAREAVPPPVYVVSGATGESGAQLVNAVLAQFPDSRVPIVILSQVREPEQVARVVDMAADTGGTIVHTLVSAALRDRLTGLAEARGVAALDLTGPLMERLTATLGQLPIGQPGRYHRLRASYYERVAAIEYAIAHDDGRNPEGWPEADVLLLGVSRTGKTPLSVYLSVLGWKVANLPLAPEVPAPEALFALERRRVIGLSIALDQLLLFRRQRSGRLGIGAGLPYANPEQVASELDGARRVFRRGGFHVIDVTDRTVEATADAIIRRVGGRLGSADPPARVR